MENKPPPVPAQGIKSDSDKMLDVQQPPFLICGADIDEKVASGRSRPLEGFHLILQSKIPPRPGSKMAPICTLFHGQEDNRPTQSPSGSHGGLVQEWPL